MSRKNTRVSRVSIRGWKPSFVGIIFAIAMLCVSLLPSLLPRPWLIQGIISGLSVAIGYGIGLLVSVIIRWLFQKEFSVNTKNIAWKIVRISAPLATILFLGLGIVWQNEVRELVGAEKISGPYGVLLVISTVIVAYLSIGVARIIRKLFRYLSNKILNKIPFRIGIGIVGGLTVFAVYFVVSGLFLSAFLDVANGIYGARDDTSPEGIVQPESSYKSGSSESVIPWEEIGYQGRGFVGSGPSLSEISEFNGKTAKEPIRIYAGLASADTAEERARLALEDLKRTNAFDRKVLIIATATGTGWLDPPVVDSVEYMYGGDTAIVSQQYSYLPSWISFLVDQEKAREAGRVLYDTILEEWTSLPEDERPKLLAYGLSLGSFGGQSAYSGINDIRRSLDGALFVGSPNDSEVWRNTTDNRDEGSLEMKPVYKEGKSVRFASTKDEILENQDQWNDETRILFLQNPTDPVVWFSFDLPFEKPDWLREPRASTVSVATRWYPIVTFLQIGLDQAIAASAPVGHGHYYIDTPVYAWSSVLPPDGWTIEDSDKLQKHINEIHNIKAN
jgi:uncharacterized membrane protein